MSSKAIRFNINLKTEKMNYEIIWKGEVVDTAETKEDALYLVGEYNMAYGGGVSYKKI